MEQKSCTACGKPLREGDWVSKSGLCRACAEAKLDEKNRPKYLMWIVLAAGSMFIVWLSCCTSVFMKAW